MSEFKGTPGPWSVARSGWDEHTGDVWYSLEGVKTSCIADANLIAAAPDLLEALDELANGYAGNRWDVGIATRLAKARAAIAKATGVES